MLEGLGSIYKIHQHPVPIAMACIVHAYRLIVALKINLIHPLFKDPPWVTEVTKL